jgi:hypothetical protein
MGHLLWTLFLRNALVLDWSGKLSCVTSAVSQNSDRKPTDSAGLGWAHVRRHQ